jgi:hypothetical protein
MRVDSMDYRNMEALGMSAVLADLPGAQATTHWVTLLFSLKRTDQ